MAESLETKLLSIFSNLYALYLKTQNYHWNLTGPHFISIHKLLEEHYEQMAEEVDELAESIRTLDIKVPANFNFLGENAEIEAAKHEAAWAVQLEDLRDSHKVLQRIINNVLGSKMLDGLYAQEDLLVNLLKSHRKMLWMLNSLEK